MQKIISSFGFQCQKCLLKLKKKIVFEFHVQKGCNLILTNLDKNNFLARAKKYSLRKVEWFVPKVAILIPANDQVYQIQP